MKKSILIVLAIIEFTLMQTNVFAQGNTAFAPSNAEWWHDDQPQAQVVDRVHARVGGDTLIQNQQAKIIFQTRYRKTWHPDNTNTIDTFAARTLFIYDTEDTVFIFNENFNRFTPLYVFNVQAGDTVCLPVVPDIFNESDLLPNPIANGDTAFCFIIDSVRTLLYDTSYLKTFFQHSININPPSYNWILQDGSLLGAYARKIGGLANGILPSKLYGGTVRPTADTLTYGPYMGGFKCYEDSSTKIHIQVSSGEGCYFDHITSIETPALRPHPMHVFPNPTDGILFIQNEEGFPEGSQLLITDISGRVLIQEKLKGKEKKISIQLQDFAPGIYLLKIQSSKDNLVQKIVLTR